MGNKKRLLQPPTHHFEMVLEPIVAKIEKRVPALYTVYLLNDDYTPMEFVVEVLERYFSMNLQIATAIMLRVHQGGKAVCGSYTREIAETKVAQVNEYARRNQHPLLCKMEETGS